MFFAKLILKFLSQNSLKSYYFSWFLMGVPEMQNEFKTAWYLSKYSTKQNSVKIFAFFGPLENFWNYLTGILVCSRFLFKLFLLST